MRMVDLIEKKRDGHSLSKEEINFIIEGYTNGTILDYQMSSLAMAIYFQGMNDEESTNLSLAMLNSGDVMDLSSIKGIKVDKHSTGGVGDKTSLVLGPLVASLGVKVAKMSGRGLGHTGGTLDKLESIKGFNINQNMDSFKEIVNKTGIAIVGQTGNLCPADKKLYALRDVTGTVPSIPLIASSIMSKKLASGADAICLDVKVGSGAFMKTIEEGRKLANLMVDIGKKCGRKMTAILTDMDEPLGFAIGNSLEVIEAINTLKGHGPQDLTDLCVEIGSYLALDANVCQTREEACLKLRENLQNGKAFNKFMEMVIAQGGDVNYVMDINNFAKASEVIPVCAQETGYIAYIDALSIGLAAMLLGAGRETKDDKIDMAVGIVLDKKIGDYVNKGDVVCYIHTNGLRTEEAISKVCDAFKYTKEKTEKKLILDVIR